MQHSHRKILNQCRSAALFLALLLSFAPRISAQLTTGSVEGVVRDSSGGAQLGVEITASGDLLASRWSAKSGLRGEFQLILPHGSYQIRAKLANGLAPAVYVHLPSRGVIHLSLTLKDNRRSGVWTITQPAILADGWGVWNTSLPSFGSFAEPYSIAGTLLTEVPAAVTEPLDFTGIQNTRIPLISDRTFSWTATTFNLEGMDATDPYQPGRPIVFPDIEAVDQVRVENARTSDVHGAFGANIGLFLQTPPRSWHGNISSSVTGAALDFSNLPVLADRGILEQTQHYNWFTRDHVDLGGALGRRVDVYFSATAQWASETVPIAPQTQNENSRLLFGTLGLRYQLTAKDQVQFLLSGSHINLSDWGEPVGLEALIGWRMMPGYESPYGFSGLAEADRLDLIQAGWIRQLPQNFRSGVFELRYSASNVHLDTKPSSPAAAPSRTELLEGALTGGPPLANFAVRQRESVRAALQPGAIQFGPERHRAVIGGGWDTSNVENRFTAPYDLDLITAKGISAYAVELNTPLDSRERVQSFSTFARDHIRLSDWMSTDLGVIGEFSRGSLPSQASPAGAFTPARAFPAEADVIAWNTVSPQIGLTLAVPGFERLLIGGSYNRFYAPLAARYLDFANPNSLSGLVFSWNDVNPGAVSQPGELGPLLRRFGGAYSSISTSLHSPHADQFEVYGTVSLGEQTSARIQFFRRDDKDRIAAIDSGVPAEAYRPVEVLDPGPDGIVGTFDDRTITLYDQSPSTFGRDKFLLENRPDLRMLYEGFTSELSTRYKQFDFHASFTAEKSFGPTNPGNGPLENDAGIVGALYQDPNTSISATGHDFFDRSFLGKIQMSYQLPSKLGGIEFLNVANYLDGLPFARELLITGLAQGPIVVPATIRGSPEGGNRAEYALNWNLRVARSFPMPIGHIRFSADVLNVTNSGNRIQENDVTGPNFNQRLPVAIEAPGFIRLALRYTF